MKYFVEQGFTFLAIKVSPAQDAVLDINDTLPPLQLSFASPQPYYPCAFPHGRGLRSGLWVLSREPFDCRPIMPSCRSSTGPAQNYRNVTLAADQLPESLQKCLQQGRLQASDWHFNYLLGLDVNAENRIASWQRDVF